MRAALADFIAGIPNLLRTVVVEKDDQPNGDGEGMGFVVTMSFENVRSVAGKSHPRGCAVGGLVGAGGGIIEWALK